MKRWMALLLCACLLLPLLPAGALAEDTADMPAEPAVTEETVPAVQDQDTEAETEENIDLHAPLTTELPVQVNPLYEGIIDPATVSRPQRPDIRPEDGLKPNATYVTEESAAVQVRNYLKSRTASFTVYVKSENHDYNEIAANLLTIAFAHTGKPTEGDYLQWQWETWGGGVSRTYVNGYYEHQLTFEFTYYTTAQQEKEMDTAVKNLLNTLNVSRKSDYQKVCAVYDYICDNVTYDYAHLEDTTYTRMFTAYAALMDKTAVCQGYALLFYRLMLELGVDNRLIAGDGGGPHAWNIVKLGDVYYNVDSTWDAGMDEYSFFLRNTVNFLGHARYLEYMTTEFHTEYPMSETDYVDGVAGVPETYYVFGSCGDEAYWMLDRKGTLTVFGESGTYDYTDYGEVEDFYPWIYWANNINALVVEEGVTYLGAYTFCHMDTLTSVSTPASLREIANNAFEDCDGLKKVSFANGLMKIGASAFSSCDALETVTLPGSMTQIGNSAFSNCIGLKELNLTEGLTSIGSYSFQYCTALTEVVLPDSVAEVAIGAFWHCTALTDVKLSASLTEIPASMFADCKNLTSVTIPEGVTIIGNYAFNNTSVETLSFPKSLKKINVNAFSNCTKLREIQFAEGLETIEQDAFARCSALKEVVIPASVTNLNGFLGCQGLEKVILNNSGLIGNYAFADCTSLKEIEFNGEITEIGTAAFGGCAGLTELNLPDTLITLDGFNRCSGLTEVRLPDSVKTVGGFIRCENLEYVDLNQCETILTYGLSECTKLESITIPETMRQIQDSAFFGCSVLKEVTFLGDAPEIHENAFNAVTTTAYYPGGNATWTDDVLRDYGGDITWVATGPMPDLASGTCGDNISWVLTFDGTLIVSGEGEVADLSGEGYPWKEYAEQIKKVIFEEGVTNVPTAAFQYRYTNLTSVELKSVEIIDYSAFTQCHQLTSVTLPEGLTEIRNGAFSNTALTSVDFPKSLVSIGMNAFTNTNLTSVVLHDGLKTMDDGAFSQCTNLKSVVLPDSITYMGTFSTFWDCTSLETVNIPNGLKSLPDMMFQNCTSLKSIVIPDSIEMLGMNTFGNSGLTSVTIPASVKQMYNPFGDCEALEEIIFEGDAPAFVDYSFRGLTLTAYYPGGNATWTEDVLQDYGGDITWIAVMPDVAFVGASLSLKGDIGLNFYAMLSERILADTGAYMKFTGSGAARYMAISEGVLDPSDGSYRYSVPLNAKNMGDDVTAQVYNADGAVGDYKTLSIKYYADYVINNSSKESFVNLMKAMLNYGAAAQVNFGYDVENLVNADMAETDRLLPDELGLCGYAHTWSGEEPGIEVTSASLLLQSETKIRIYFKLNEGYELSDFVFTVDGVEVTPVQSGEEYYIEKPNVAAKDLDTMYTFRLGNRQLIYCGLSYVNQVLAYSSNEKLLNLAKALYAYNQAANAYFQPDEAPAHGHNYESVVTEPTCTDGGYTTHTCTFCGDSYTDTETDALGHDWGNWYLVEDGFTGDVLYEERVCERDGCEEIETREYEDIAATCEHDWRKRNGGGYYCPLCKTTVEELPEGDHCHEFEWVCDPSWEFDTGTCTTCGEQRVIDGSNAQYADDVITYINEYRVAAGLNPLTLMTHDFVRIRAEEITIQFDHRRLDGSQSGMGECIATGSSAKSVVDMWYNSSSHNGTIMHASATHAMAACCGGYWVVLVF